MTYQKWSEQDDKMRNLVDDGLYAGTVIETSNNPSKKGDPMASFTIEFQDINERPRKIKDWMLLTGEMSWKYRHAAESAGLINNYENDSLNVSDFLGKRICFKLTTKDGQDQHGMAIKRNVIVDYVVEQPLKNIDGFNDEIPF